MQLLNSVIHDAYGSPCHLILFILEKHYNGVVFEKDNVKYISTDGKELHKSLGFSLVSIHAHINKLEHMGIVKRVDHFNGRVKKIGLHINFNLLYSHLAIFLIKRSMSHEEIYPDSESNWQKVFLKSFSLQWRQSFSEYLADACGDYPGDEMPKPSWRRPPLYVRKKWPKNPFQDPYSQWELTIDNRVVHKWSDRVVNYKVSNKLMRQNDLGALRSAYKQHPLEVELAVDCLGITMFSLFSPTLKNESEALKYIQLTQYEQVELMFGDKISDISVLFNPFDSIENKIQYKKFTYWWIHHSTWLDRIKIIDNILSNRYSIINFTMLFQGDIPYVQRK